MTPAPDVQARLRRYLLGQLDDDGRVKIEADLLRTGELFEELLVTEDKLVDEYVSGKLSGDELIGFEQHFLAHLERQQKLRFGRAFNRYLSSQASPSAVSELPANPLPVHRGWAQNFLSSPVKLAVFAIIIAAAALGLWRIFLYQSEVDKGLLALNAAYRDQRPLESRITSLNYAPYLVTRGPADEKIDLNELRRAELTLLDALNKNPTPAVHHALGNLYLAKKDFDKAIEQFGEALKGDTNNAQLYNDLGAAWLEKGKLDRANGRDNPGGPNAGKGTEDFARSVENLNRARQLNPNLWEALFNNALVHEAMGLPQAEDDWRQYLVKDANSKWADEARRHLRALEEKKKARSQNKKELLREFMEAYQSHDDGRAFDLLSKNTEAVGGQLMWWQLAGDALRVSVASGNGKQDSFEALSYAGSVQEQKTGDRFLSALARFYRGATRQQQESVAQAHAMINEGHALLGKSDVARAIDCYTKAKVVFDGVGDEGDGLFADYWIGYSHYRRSNFNEGRTILGRVADRCKEKNFLSLLEKALTMTANLQLESSQYSKSIESYSESLEISTKIADVYNLQKNLSSLANGYRSLGQRQASLAYLELCLESADAHWPGGRQMYRNYYVGGDVLNSFGYQAAAAEFEKAAIQLAIEESDPILQNQSYVALTAIYLKLKNYPEALKYAGLSYEAAAKMEKGTEIRPTADAWLYLGHVNRLTGDYAKALGYYDEAIKYYDRIKHFAMLYEAHKGRLLDYIAQNKDAEAKAELIKVLALFEEHRWKIREERNRNSFFDVQQDVYDIAINFEYSRSRDSQKAFEYSEASRARSLLDLIGTSARTTGTNGPDLVISSVKQPLDLKGIREQMPEQAQILQYAVLDDKLLAWVISRTKFETIEKRIDAASLNEKVVSYRDLLSSSSGNYSGEFRRRGMELYEILIKPVEPLLEKNKQIYVVPDKVLNSLAFNALISPDTGRYLVNDYTFALAPSSNVFVVSTQFARQRSEAREERLLSIGNPNFDRVAFKDFPELPSAGKEAAAIASYYSSPQLLLGEQATKKKVWAEMNRADVVHLASHYLVNDQNPMLSELLLSKTPGNGAESSDNVLQAYEISNRKLPITRLVTLSACRTGVERYYSGEGMIGMSRTFLAAEVPTVVASLWPVDSDPTADLMTSLHKFRKQDHLSTAEALRQSQLEMLASKNNQPYYWASFVLIGGYATF